MDTKKTCYLVFDFDGTVTIPGRPAGRIPKEHLEALRYAKAKGHRLILSTGRSRGFLEWSPSYKSIPWDGIIVGGADIYWKGKCICQHWIEDEDVLRLTEYAMLCRSRLNIEGQRSYFLMDFRRRGMKSLLRRDRERILAKVRRFLLGEHVTKMSITPCRGEVPRTEAEFLLHGKRFGEFGPQGCDKGRAIERLCQRRGIPLSQCIVFGDSLNDLAMFETVRESVCMAHAPEALKAAASFTAKGAFGVAEGIYHYFGEKK